ncbi:ubiquitin carboxyl-terminal hydrolase [Plectosphaerella plurivora]|uniref:ubiquitinyl hydrolase 1 n=1 Tax=Plectosphaerella plurivora TaxID=936078 RepID=A0A9P9AGX4_9PEZI|nr:ubiquitin carboxyl-terminal hydrolase [Plectosphaerella plurivora]
MSGDSDLHQRSSSPLKRRASSMDPENDTEMADSANTPAAAAPTDEQQPIQPTSAPARTHYARAMSVDTPSVVVGQEKQEESAASLGGYDNLQVQIKTISTMVEAFNDGIPKVGVTGFAVSRTWLDKALRLGGISQPGKQDQFANEPLGPVDNEDIIRDVIQLPDGAKFARFKPGISMEDFVFFPDDAWDMVKDWYGLKDGQVPVEREVIDTAESGASGSNNVFELNPPVFTVHRLWSAAADLPVTDKIKEAPPIVLVASASTPYNELFKTLKQYAGIPLDRKIRVHTILPSPELVAPAADSETRSAFTPPDSPERETGDNPETWNKLLIDVKTFTSVDSSRRSRLDIQDHTNNANYNGKSTLAQQCLAQDQILVLDEQLSKNDYVSTSFGKRNSDKIIASRGVQSKGSNSGRNSPALSTRSGPVTRGRARQKKVTRTSGVVGLNNLGNTCYMNSALQCIRSVEELTKYFLTDEYLKEVNSDNPLGWNGQVANSYGALLKEIYRDSRSAVAPREFKSTIGRCRPTFSGWAQQDTQEFLGFLLDGLQEDLNRIEKKPYIEKPDSTDEMIGNDEAIREMADKVWDITRRRDDSVIADLFTGMYKSTLQCPVCDKISITFDPFNNLTLPIPVEDMWSHTIKFYPLNDAPVEFDVDLPKHSPLALLKKFVSERSGVPVERLFGAEEYQNKFYKLFDDAEDVGSIGSNDIAVYHELESQPTNWPMKAAPVRSMLDIDDDEPFVDPRTERLVVPVFHKKASTTYSHKEVMPAHFIVLTRDEASNEDAIRRKILEKVSTISNWTGFTETDDAVDPDIVLTTQSDADSSGDGKVIAHSVEGEDDMVEVSMKDAEASTPGALKEFNKKRPQWVDTNQHLPAQLQNLFEMYYMFERSEKKMPTGWHDLDKTHARLSSRAPASESSSEHESNSPSTWTTGADSDRESDGQSREASEPTLTRMNEESSEEDEPIVQKPAKGRGKPMNRPGPGGRNKFRPQQGKKFGKKGGKRRNKEMRSSKDFTRAADIAPQPSPHDTSAALVRIGEGIVVEWESSVADDVFPAGTSFTNVDKVKDSALELRRKGRARRRNNGCTLDECLDEFERAEVLSEHDEWYCPRCKEHRRASKKFDLWKSPDILVVHLKRFSSAGYRREKLDVLVNFPVEGLDLTKRVLNKENGKEEIFDLIAVDEHSGGLGGGHYTAAAKNFIDGSWHHYNDSGTSKCRPEDAITKMAYLLFYRRRGSGALGGPRFKEIFDRFDQENGSGEDDGSDDAEDSGEGQRLGGGSYQNGSSRLGTGAAATHPRDRGLAISTMSTQALDSLPPYDEEESTITGSDTIHNSIEDDEGVGMADAQGYDAMQPWNFGSIMMQNNGTPGGYGSDDAQASDEPDTGDLDPDVEDLFGADAPEVAAPPPDYNAQVNLSGIQTAAWDRKTRETVIAVPSGDDDVVSNEAAEIHLDDDEQQPPVARP